MGTGSAAHAYDRENHANARCLSPFFHKLSAKDHLFRGAVTLRSNSEPTGEATSSLTENRQLTTALTNPTRRLHRP